MAATSTRKVIEQSIEIDANREAIWSTVTDDKGFRDWGSAFHEGSYFVGDWSEGSELRFIGDAGDGNDGGMVVKVLSHVPTESVKTVCTAVIMRGEELTSGEDYDEWVGIHEEYRLVGESAPYRFEIKNEVPDRFYETFSTDWSKALQRIKDIAEAKG